MRREDDAAGRELEEADERSMLLHRTLLGEAIKARAYVTAEVERQLCNVSQVRPPGR